VLSNLLAAADWGSPFAPQYCFYTNLCGPSQNLQLSVCKQTTDVGGCMPGHSCKLLLLLCVDATV
jgi:hypothetical protein